MMAKQVFTLYIVKDIGQYGNGSVSVQGFDMSKPIGSRPSDYVLLGTQEVEIDVPDVDTTQIQIDALNEQIKTERAESQSRVNILLDRISKLQCITHNGGAE